MARKRDTGANWDRSPLNAINYSQEKAREIFQFLTKLVLYSVFASRNTYPGFFGTL